MSQWCRVSLSNENGSVWLEVEGQRVGTEADLFDLYDQTKELKNNWL